MIKGHPDKTYAIVQATIGFILFMAVTLFAFLLPDNVHMGHIVFGSITGVSALLMFPWQILDTRNREYRLEESSLIYKAGIFPRYETEIPYSSIKGVSIKQGPLQRLVGCADVRVTAPGIQDRHIISSADLNSIALRSLKNYEEIGQHLRDKMKTG